VTRHSFAESAEVYVPWKAVARISPREGHAMSTGPEHDAHPASVLATRVISARDRHFFFTAMKSGRFLLTNEAVHRLIRLAYDASLLEDEGRSPTARLVCSRAPLTVRFGDNPPWDSPALREADDLRRIAPTAKRPGSALAIAGVGPTDLRCTGLYEFAEIIDQFSRTAVSTAWEMGETLSGPLLTVRIEGPGRIRAGFLPAQTFLLRGGQVGPHCSWAAIPAVSSLFEDGGKALHARLAQIEHPLAAQVLELPWQCEYLLAQVWGHLLGVTAAARHGGAFVVTFEDAGTLEKAGAISDGHPAGLDLGSTLTAAIHESLRDAGDNFQAFRQAWQGRRLMLFHAAEQIAGLSAVDGCVLLDRNLNPIRFGAKLHSKESHDDPELQGKGTRHGSAYQLCAEHRAVAFVVSQDGGLTVIASVPGGRPEVVGDVEPGVQWSQL
jgi:hypothetical protein